MRKSGFVLLLTLFTANFCNAQFYKSVLPSPEFSNALEKIVLDFRVNFSTIQGNSLVSAGETETYESTVKLPGASECIIYKYHSKADTTASWQGLMYKGDDYKEAARVYENVFRLVKKSQVRWIDKSMVGFEGNLEKPTEDLKFAVSTLNFQLEDKRYKNFQADVEMVSNYSGWEVHLNLQTKHPDDNDGG
ncbi:hypothetical protein [Segetibacter aerophilus]|uniref:Uncharacterized protein n=1 Tax=Segetibacter aerophilus TaxID=670293 RepID=A0A512B703_9BACT|nr:hypothetical protein [Segetibacter aerophilus]GEO07726.1 hypothetical protein SAE01_02220 [Segetibacter aerophilus]